MVWGLVGVRSRRARRERTGQNGTEGEIDPLIKWLGCGSFGLFLRPWAAAGAGATGDRAGGGQVTGSRGQGILEPGEQQVLACPGQAGRKLSYGVLTVDSKDRSGGEGS